VSIDIFRAEREAQDLDGTVKFDLCGPLGRKSCTWLDPYMGLFQIDGDDGFLMTRDIPPSLWVENQRVEP